MKRSYQIILIAALVMGSFWGGARYNERGAGKDHDPRREGRVLYYVDPMNPAHTSDQPGLAPCGMPMEPVYADDETSGAGNIPRFMPPGTAKITPEKQQMIGVRVEKVEVTSHGHALRRLGRVSVDENRIYRMIAGTEGWVWEVQGSTTGSLVQKDQLMALINIYSTDFYTLQQQYLAYAGRLRQPGVKLLTGQSPWLQQPEAQHPGPQIPGTQLRRAPQTQAQPAGTHQPQAQQPEAMEPEGQQAEAQQPEPEQLEAHQTDVQQPATHEHEERINLKHNILPQSSF